MSEAPLIRRNSTSEPVRRSSEDKNSRLYFKGNFDRVIEVTSAAAAPQNARRGK
jgi:hypothetical protein